MKLKPGPVGLGLQVENRQLDLLLFITRELAEGGSKAIGQYRQHLSIICRLR